MGVQSPTLAQGLGRLTAGLCQQSGRQEASRGPERSLPQPVLLTEGQEAPSPALPPLSTQWLRSGPRSAFQNQQSCPLARPPHDGLGSSHPASRPSSPF